MTRDRIGATAASLRGDSSKSHHQGFAAHEENPLGRNPGDVRVGLIARADSRGLGVQCLEFFRAMSPVKTMVVDCPSADPLPLRRDWYPGATWVAGLPTAADFRRWLDGVDVVYTAETGYGRALWSEAERAGVKTVLHLNREFLDPHDRPTLWAAPSMWRYDEVPDPKMFLPVPIATDRFTDRPRPATATNFLHIVGRPAIHDRNGTTDLLAALPHLRSRVTVTIRCQDPTYVPGLLRARTIPANVELVIQSGDTANYSDNYRVGDVLVMPRRFGGLSLVVNEGLGAGMPVIMPNISPNEWLPADWLVPATKTASFTAKTRVDVYTTDPQALAARMDEFAAYPVFYATALVTAQQLAKDLSWDTLRPVYEKVFEEL